MPAIRSLMWTTSLGMLVLACQTGPGPAPTASTTRTHRPAGLSPIENYKEQRLADALRGLTYDTGRVRIDEEAARDIAQRGSIEEALAEARRGEALLADNYRLDAIRAFTRAVIIAPDAPETYRGLAGALAKKGLTQNAEAALRAAIDLDPDYVDAWFDLGHVRQLEGRFPEAIDAWNEVLARTDDHADAHHRLALANYYEENYADAWTHTQRAEALGTPVPPQFKPLIQRKMSEPGS